MQKIKTVIFGILALTVAYILAFGRRPGGDIPKDRVVVRYWEKWTNKEAAQMREIVDDFNNTVGKDKGIFVQYLSMSSIDQKTLVSTAAGVPPDVAGVWEGQVPQFAAIDALEPMDEYAKEHGITPAIYKPVYWEGCTYNGKLYAMVSTPGSVALHYNKRIFQENADKLRKAGLDPNRPPATLDELDKYAAALDEFDSQGKITRTGYLHLQPGWWMSMGTVWWGGKIFDFKAQKFTLTSPGVLKYFEWIQSYSKRLGGNAVADFNGSLGGFDSPQNPFMVGKLVMEQQGPWLANYIENNAPKMNRWVTKDDEQAKKEEINWPIEKRRTNYEWGAAPFPSAVAGMKDVAHCPFDVLIIPKGARHKREAFEFIAFVNTQKEMEKLCMLHCKNSPLAKVSQNYLDHHPNPYIKVFDDLASSPNAVTVPPIPIWPEVNDEMSNAAQSVYLLQDTPRHALQVAQERLQKRYDYFIETQRSRGNTQVAPVVEPKTS